MNIKQRINCASKKIGNYLGEASGLRNSGIGYKLGFGLLLLILFPVLLFELLLVLFFGKDNRVFVPHEPVLPPQLIEEEVPESLRDLIR